MSGDFESLLEQMLPGAGHQSTVDAEAPPFPTSLGLEPRDILGRGGTGWVYRAWDPVIQRDVAVKISRAEGGETARRAVLAEAQRTAALVHPAILPVFRVAAADGLLTVVFQLAPRRTLAAVLADWKADPMSAWELSERLLLLSAIADAVATAHQADVIHGDLKPSNIAVRDNKLPYVLDWGGLSIEGGQFSGTPAYAAPELLQGDQPTPASDVWALAALTWETLTLRPLRTRRAGRTMGELIEEWRRAGVPDLSIVHAIDPDLASSVQHALSTDTDARPSAQDFQRSLQRVLTGKADRSRREQWAAKHLADARRHLLRFHEGERILTEEKQVVAVQRMKVASWAPEQDKRPLWSAEDRMAQALDAQALAWTEAVESALVATTLRPDDNEAHQILADIWVERLVMAEARGYAGEAALCMARIHQHDRGRHQALLQATASLSLEVDAKDALCTLWRPVQKGRRLEWVREKKLTPPIQGLELAAGSWLITVEAPDKQTTRYPVLLHRHSHHRGHVRPRSDAEIGAGMCLVPAGPFRMGGDPQARQAIEACTPRADDLYVQRTPTRCSEWLQFLLQLDPGERADHLPSELSPFTGRREIWAMKDGMPELPEFLAPDAPVTGITQQSAQLYAKWRSSRLDRTLRLPTEEEWAKFARGADGRLFPWGNHFDPAYCHMRGSRRGSPAPGPVASYDTDCSVYGVYDLAGSVREWTTTTWGDGRVVVRGGGWNSDESACRLATRVAQHPDTPATDVGFRLVSDEPNLSPTSS